MSRRWNADYRRLEPTDSFPPLFLFFNLDLRHPRKSAADSNRHFGTAITGKPLPCNS
jgi:hypothetical protein